MGLSCLRARGAPAVAEPPALRRDCRGALGGAAGAARCRAGGRSLGCKGAYSRDEGGGLGKCALGEGSWRDCAELWLMLRR